MIRRRSSPRVAGLLFALALLASVAGCGDDTGSGEYQVAVRRDSGPVGAVALEVSGGGVMGFEGVVGTTVFSAPVAGAQGRWRVVALHQGTGELGFVIRMADRSEGRPSLLVIEAADADNVPVDPPTDVRAVFGS
jgi:hypothetical protein